MDRTMDWTMEWVVIHFIQFHPIHSALTKVTESRSLQTQQIINQAVTI